MNRFKMMLGLSLVSAALLLACSASDPSSPSSKGSAADAQTSPRAAADSRVVIGLAGGGGINAHHRAFRAGGSLYPNTAPASVTPAVLVEFGIDAAHIIDLEKTARSDVRANPKELYWFKGTNILGITANANEPLISSSAPAGFSDINEGSAAVAAALTENPEAIILFVSGGEGDLAGSGTPYILSHPSVDIALSSIPGFPIGVGVAVHLPFTITGIYDGVVRLGKLHLADAGRNSIRTTQASNAGNWWTVAIGDVSVGESFGTEQGQNLPVDFGADSVKTGIPSCGGCDIETETSLLTSGGSAAGAVSKAILAARRLVGHTGGIRPDAQGRPSMIISGDSGITNWQVRRALEQAAYVAQVTDYDPAQSLTGLHIFPVLGPATYLNSGWGILSGDDQFGLVDRFLIAIGLKEGALTDKGPAFCNYQTEFMQERHAYWDTVTRIDVDHNPVAGDPYIYCDMP